jgi:hypothetical protein
LEILPRSVSRTRTSAVNGVRSLPSTQESGQAVQTRIRLGIEAVVRQIPFAADRQHTVAHIIPIPPGMRQRVPPAKLGHIAEPGRAVQLRHPGRDGVPNDGQIPPAVQLSGGSRDRHERAGVLPPSPGVDARPMSAPEILGVHQVPIEARSCTLCSNRLDLNVFPARRSPALGSVIFVVNEFLV